MLMTPSPPPDTGTLHDRHAGDDPVLSVRGLRVSFARGTERVEILKGLDFDLHSGRTLAVLGESGSGKSMTAMALMGLLEGVPGCAVSGSVRFRGQELSGSSQKALRRLRGRHLAMVFQDALSALNPVYTVGWQIAEIFRIHEGLSRRDAERQALDLMRRVRIPDPERRAGQYPHEFSGGMRQRVMIAMAVALRPSVLIADEPTTALDATVQLQIMELISDLQREMGMAVMLITHDFGVVAEVADDVLVMYAGRMAESAAAPDVFRGAAHPYTRALIASMPASAQPGQPLRVIEGNPPDPFAAAPGCAFEPRCGLAREICRKVLPPPVVSASGGLSACHFTREAGGDAAED